MFVLTTLAVVLLALHAWAVSAQDCSCYDKVCLYESIKSQLTSTYNADNLLFGFFTKIPFYGSVNISSAVNLSFQFVNGTSWYNEEITWTHFWYPYSSTGALRTLFPWTFRGAVASNSYSKTLDLAVSISCVSNTMNPVTLKTSLNDLYSSILQWVSLLRQSLQLAVSGQDCSCYDNVCLYEAIKSQLTSTYNADNLLFGFFTKIPFYGSVNISSAVNLAFKFVNGTSWYNEEITWTHFWYPYSSTGVLRKLFPSIFRGAMDPWSALPVVAEIASNNYFVKLNVTVSISCLSNTTDPEALISSLNSLYTSILQWGKSLARTYGFGAYPDDGDRGIVYDAKGLSPTDLIAFYTFVLLYVFFNIAVAILLMTTAPIALKSLVKQIKEKKDIKSYIKSLFWSAVITGAVYITVYIIIKILIFTGRDNVKMLANGAKVLDLIDDFTIISVVVPLFLFGVHIITAVFASRVIPSDMMVPKKMQHIIRRFCCQSCTHVLWTFSLWVVLAWLQLIAVSFIPVVISVLTDTFRSIAVFGLLLATIACVAVCSAVLMQSRKANQSIPKVFMFFSVAACLFSCLTVVAFTTYFLVLSREGLDADTYAGYVLSLIPSLALAALAYFGEKIMAGDKDSGETGDLSETDAIKETIDNTNVENNNETEIFMGGGDKEDTAYK